LERLVTVADQTARFALTTSDVQLGDTVKQLDTGVMYIVSDESKLSSNDGYTEYTAGSATSVPWSGVSGKPSSFTPSSHTHGSITNDGKLGTASRALVTDSSKKIAVSSVTSTELGYLSGVTSAIQTQLNGKSDSGHTHSASDVSGLSTVATTGSYNDLSNKPTIPTVNNATLTIQKNGSTVKTFTANASSNVTANITVPTKTSELTNDSHQTITTDTDTTSAESPAHSGTFTCIDSVTRDSNGHVTKVNTKTITLPSDNNTDTLVTQNVSTTNASYPILCCPTPEASANQGAKTSVFGSGVKINPYYSQLFAENYIANGMDGLRIRQAGSGKYSAIFRNDGAGTYILVTNENDPDGSWNDFRPLHINNATGICNITGNVSGSSGSCTGNAATATNATNNANGKELSNSIIKGLSVSGKTITYTQIDGTSGTITTQDTNTDTLMTQNVSTTNATYPILLCATADATADQGAKTGIFGSGVKVNPSTSTISATIFSGSLFGNAATSSGLVTNTGIVQNGITYTGGSYYIGNSAGQLYKGSSNNAALISAPENGTFWTETLGNVQNLRFSWANDGKYLHDIFVSPNNDYIWHRNVGNSVAKSWRRIVEENVSGLTNQTWDISIAGNAATASSVAWTNVSGRPTNVSSFTNDSGYLTSHQSLSNYSTLANTVKSLSISGKTITVTPGSGSAYTLTTQDTVYTHPTTAGNKHIPSGGSANQYLKYSASGTAAWATINSSELNNDQNYSRGLNSHAINFDWSETYSNKVGIKVDNTWLGGILTTANTTIPTKTSDLTNDSGFLTSHQSLSNYVTLNGNQIITGQKTFQSGGTTIKVKATNHERGVKPSTDSHNIIQFCDKSGYQIGYITRYKNTSGYSCVQINSSDYYKNEAMASDGTEVGATFTIGTSSKGNPYWQAPMGSWENIYPHSERNNSLSIGTFTNRWNQVFANEYHAYNGNGYMLTSGDYTFLIRNDGGSTYFLVSEQNGDEGTWSTARPLQIVNSTGICNINGNAATSNEAKKVKTSITAGTVGTLVDATMGSNDCFRIAAGGDANAGWVELATGDDYSEPIYVRQYQGTYTTLKRSATLLDANGNTDFPGTVTATFSGNLTGNVTGNVTGDVTGNCSGYSRGLLTTNVFGNDRLTYTEGGILLGSDAGKLFKGSSNNAALVSAPENGTFFSDNAGNVQNLRFTWAADGKYLHDIFVSPNNNYIWHRDVVDGTAKPWRRVVEENATGLTNQTWSINVGGNAATATQFSSNKSVTLTGDVTGTASSKAGWSVATTLANSGVTAGTYGPSDDVTGNNNATISVPEITVDAKGRVTSVVNRTLTCKNNTYTVNNATLTIQKNGTNVATFTSNASANATANITVPTKVSELTNDLKYTCSLSGNAINFDWSTQYANKVGIKVDTTWLGGILTTANTTIPTKTSQLTNDSGFLTSHQSLANYVTLNGAQTISGQKIFTVFPAVRNTVFELGATPSSDQYAVLEFFDKNSVQSGWVGRASFKNGHETLTLSCNNKFSNGAKSTIGSNVYSTFAVGLSPNGLAYLDTNAGWASNVWPMTNNTVDLGTASLKWRNLFVGEIHCYNPNVLMAKNGDYTFLIRNDGSYVWFLMSTQGGNEGTYSDARPLVINNATGVCDINGNCGGSSNGLASSSSFVQNGLTYSGGMFAIGNTAGNAYKGSSNNASLISFPENGTYWNDTTVNIQNLRFTWANDGKYFQDIFLSPNNDYIWHRNVVNGTARGWRRVVEENVSGLIDQTWNINIGGSSGSCTGNATTASQVKYKLQSYTPGTAPSSNLIYEFNRIENSTGDWNHVCQTAVRTNDTVDATQFLNRNSVVEGIRFELSADGSTANYVPTRTNKINLGTNDNRWKSINGVNPGALFLPKISSKVSLSERLTDLTGQTSFHYTPPYNGWISIETDNTRSSNFIRCSYDNILVKTDGNAQQSGMSILCPVLAGVDVIIYVKCVTLTSAFFYPSLGDVNVTT